MNVPKILYFAILLLITGSSVSADEPLRPTPRQRVRIPAQLDAPTLQKLLDTIEQPGVASALKVSYFGGRASTRAGAQGLPVAEGFALLKTSLEKEPVASKRWFWFENVRGWAAFRCMEISPDEGFAAYAELFVQAGKARAAKEVYAPQLAVGEWVASVNGRMGWVKGEDGMNLRDDERTAGVLLAAWQSYVSLLQQTSGRWNGREPDWSAALERAGANDEFVALVEKTLAVPNAPKTFGFLNGAAGALRYSKPERALGLFKLAQTLLPKDEAGKIEARIAEKFFDAWMETIAGQESTPQTQSAALGVAHSRIALTGSGYGALLKLQIENKDEAGVAATLETLGKPEANEREIVAAAAALNSAWDKERKSQKLAAQSQALLNGYLNAARERGIATEIEARYRLAWLLFENKQRAEAKVALDISSLKFEEKNLAFDTQSQLQFLRNLKTQISQSPN